MKLVLKLPKDKLPFIGIQFASNYVASKTNSDLVSMLDKEDCHLILKPYDKHYLNLRLVNKEKFVNREYKQIEYNNETLKRWLEQTKGMKQINFSHVIMDFDKHVVVKISINKNFIIKLSKVKLEMEE